MSTLAKSVVGVAAVAIAALVVGVVARSASQPLVPSSAQALGAAPTTVNGTADAHRLKSDEPQPSCAAVEGVKWYTVTAPQAGPVLARLVAHGDLKAALVAYRIVHGRRTPLACRPTANDGRARVGFYGFTTGSYLLGVGRQAGSPKGDFELSVMVAEPPSQPPGTPLPAEGVTSTVNSVLDRTDAWSLPMARGTTYRLALTTISPENCVGYAVYPPATTSFTAEQPVLDQECGGYATFTPGVDGGGTYTVLVRTTGAPLTHVYRLSVGPAGADDTAPGISLANGQVAAGTVSGRGLDAVDLYRFSVPRAGELTTIRLLERRNAGLELLVMTEMGRRVAGIRQGTGAQALRLHMLPGHYYAAMRATDRAAGRYSLQVQVRDITATTLTAAGGTAVETAPATAIPLSVRVTAASHGGPVVIMIDHYDPLFRWHFATSLVGRVDSAGNWTTSWTPPSVGTFRAHARFVGTPYSSFSSSGYVTMHVVEPLE